VKYFNSRISPLTKTSLFSSIQTETGLSTIISPFVILLCSSISKKAELLNINSILRTKDLGVRAASWKKAMGVIGNLAIIIKGALFLFVIFLFFVAGIIIVNTLTMSAIERTSEIGMMRAIGANKAFIREMFFTEIGILSFIFGGFGIIIGIIFVQFVPVFNITAGDNHFLEILYGGDRFKPILSALDILFIILQLVTVTVLSSIYPIKVANSITPLQAISRD